MMPYDVWGNINQGQTNFMNALAMRKQQEQADARNAILAQQTQASMRMKEDEFARSRQMDQMKIEEAQRAQQVQQVKGAYNILNSINSQADLDRARGYMQQNAPEYLTQVPEVYDDKGKAAIDGYKNLYRNVAVDQFKMTERWVKDANGNRYPVLLDQNENPADMQLPEGYHWINKDLEKTDIEQQGAIDKQRASDAAAMEREQAGNQSAMNIAKYNAGADLEKEKLKLQSEETRARMQQLAASGAKTFENEQKLRKEFDALPEVKTFIEVDRNYNMMDQAVKDIKKQAGDSGKPWASYSYADQALITTFNKMLDPTSVVRESEYARTSEDQAWLSRLKSGWDAIYSGGKLNEPERKAIFRMAKNFRDASKEKYDVQDKFYKGLFKDYGLNKEHMSSVRGTPNEIAADYEKSQGAQNYQSMAEEFLNGLQ